MSPQHKLLMLNISFGCCRHSVSNTSVQLTEGRSARDQPKQLPAKKKLKATGLQLQSANSWFVWWQTKATATTAICELEFWVKTSWKMGCNCNLGIRGFLWWLGCQFDCNVRPGFSWRRALENYLLVALSTFLCGQPMCIALLSPEVRWSEMEWHVSLVEAFRLSVRGEMNGLFYTSIFYRNECGGFHVRRAVVCGWLFTLGTLLFR